MILIQVRTEMDNCLKEVDRIANDTTFNTKQILKGNLESVIQVTGDEEIEVRTIGTAVIDLPSWMAGKVDTKMERHAAYTLPQDTSGIMKTYDGINDSSKKYYGPKDASGVDGYQWVGDWTPTISDNALAKVDFSGLVDKNTATDLYQALYELIGYELAYPCGTCSSETNGIFFSASEETFITTGHKQMAEKEKISDLNLSTTKFSYNGKDYDGYFEAVQDVLDKYSVNYDDDANNDITGEDSEVKALAESIAKDLRDKAADKLCDSMKDHFDRVVKGNDDYSLIVYDYRDIDKIASNTAADSEVKTSALTRYEMSANMLIPGTTAKVKSPLRIMCGALNSSYIDIHLYDLSLDSLGLTGYKANRYYNRLKYSDDYKQKMQAWEDSATEVTKTFSNTQKVIDTVTPDIYGSRYNANGEKKRFLISKGSVTFKEETRTFMATVKENKNPKPQPKDGDITVETVYSPDSVKYVDDAIDQVSRARSSMGAIRNRLEHAYNNNANTSENTQAVESRLRDTDMAEEMMEYSKNNILEQAGISMLTQANQNFQGILGLLQ